VGVESDSQGKPHVHGPFPNDIRVSITHRAGIACAIAAEGKDPGIDIEAIEPRGDGFATIAFAAEELRLLPADDDEWRTRLWAAKEAAGKANGTGLAGNPRGLFLAAVERERMLVDGRRIQTRKFGDNIIAWTVQ
jgi:phosphopantetheinyl transferase